MDRTIAIPTLGFLLSGLLPGARFTWDDPKQRMMPWPRDQSPAPRDCRRARAELCLQVTPFGVNLPARFLYLRMIVPSPDFTAVESIAPRSGFLRDGGEIGVDRRHGPVGRPEAQKLGMRPIAPRTPRQDGTREERLAPESDKSSRVEISRMNRPESHAPSLVRRRRRQASAHARLSMRPFLTQS